MLLEDDLKQRDLARRIGPILRDGTPLRSLFDFEKREVALRVMNDAELHELEMERIFGRAWLHVGHESEIPNAGDFLIRYMGENPVIVARANDGSINILINACAHRGMEVCFADRGNTDKFLCPYHGWIYDVDGRLRGVPFEQEMMGSNWDKTDYGLPRVHTVVRHGIIWGNLADDPVPFEDYLGDMLWYHDLLLGGHEWKAIDLHPARNLVHANWKANLDQNQGDFLHTISLHKDLTELGIFGQDFGQYSTKVSMPPHGHMAAVFEPNFSPEGGTISQTKDLMEDRKAMPLGDRGWAFLTYPTSFGGAIAMPMPDGSMFKIVQLVMHLPHGPDKFEFNGVGLMLVHKDTPDEMIELIKRMQNSQRGLTGVGANDNEAWRSITKAAKGVATRKKTLKYPGIGGPKPAKDWEGPGVTYEGFSRDDTHWHGWLHYFDVMTADEA